VGAMDAHTSPLRQSRKGALRGSRMAGSARAASTTGAVRTPMPHSRGSPAEVRPRTQLPVADRVVYRGGSATASECESGLIIVAPGGVAVVRGLIEGVGVWRRLRPAPMAFATARRAVPASSRSHQCTPPQVAERTAPAVWSRAASTDGLARRGSATRPCRGEVDSAPEPRGSRAV
jgi:hypothetical protein